MQTVKKAYQQTIAVHLWVGPHYRFLTAAVIPALAALLLLALNAALAPRAAVAQDAPTTYLVRFQPGLSEQERAAQLAQAGAKLVSWLPQIDVAEVRLAGGPVGAAALDSASVLYVEADAPVSGDHVITDPGYVNADQSYAQRLLRVASAWNVDEGISTTVVAIVDSGIDASHPEFAGRVLKGYDFINSDDDATDDCGHGTHVAGIVAAGLNGVGMVGVCPRCALLPVKVLNDKNAGSWSTVAKGILYAVDHGAKVINLSLGAAVNSATVESAVDYARTHDVVVVAAAGNNAANTSFFPAAIPYVLAVAGTDRTDQRWALSNYGDWVDIAAPANGIYSTYKRDPATTGYAYMSGTSMAAPFVTGEAALVRSHLPKLPAVQVINLITSTVVDLGAAGKDAYFGWGRASAYNALVAANGGVEPPPDEATAGEIKTGAGSLPNHLYLPLLAAHPKP